MLGLRAEIVAALDQECKARGLSRQALLHGLLASSAALKAVDWKAVREAFPTPQDRERKKWEQINSDVLKCLGDMPKSFTAASMYRTAKFRGMPWTEAQVTRAVANLVGSRVLSRSGSRYSRTG